MPEFRFLLTNDEPQFALADGIELADPEAARMHAKLAAFKVFRSARVSYDWSNWRLSVRDQDGEELAEISIPDVLALIGKMPDPAGTPS